jgi:4-hydroxy-tetrahydrodipicolinate reductase
MTIRVLINGAHGKMGRECVKAIENDAALQLVAAIGRADDLAAMLQQSQAQVAIDLTAPHAVYENALAIIAAGVHPVIGTTGLTPAQIANLEQRCAQKKLGGVIAPNFSIGAILMMRFAAQAAKYLPDVEIIELHHPAKLDSPSGTALKTADIIAEARTAAPQQLPVARETIPGARGAFRHGVPIHAVRLPGLVACQEVLFGGLGETLRISHHTIHREAFVPGVLLACKKVVELDRLLYGLEHLL